MRDIKFRAWFENEDIQGGGCMIEDIGVGDGYFKMCANDVCGESLMWTFEIDNATSVMQYAGIKDINGNELYEGDVIMSQGIDARKSPIDTHGTLRRHYNGKKLRIGFKQGRYVAMTASGGKRCRKYPLNGSLIYSASYILVGNIYQHPELIKKHTT